MNTRTKQIPPAVYFRVIYRDRFTCLHCGKTGEPGVGDDDLQVHHRLSLAAGGDHSPENLETLCGTCHQRADHAQWKAAVEASKLRLAARQRLTTAAALALGDALLTVDQAAAYLGVSGQRVRKLLRDGRLPCQKHGRAWLLRGQDLALVTEPRHGRPSRRDALLPTIILRRAEGVSWSSISRELGVSMMSVQRWYKARDKS